MMATSSPLIDVHKRPLSELLADREPRSLVLVFGALVRVFTLGQMARLAGDGDMEATEALLDELHYTDRWIDRLDDVKLPRHCGGGTVSVYYLTARGAEALKHIALEIHKHARPGQPKGNLRERIPHELLVAEAFIWLHERYRVIDFWPETELKSQMGKARARAAKDRHAALPDEATGDFKVRLIDRDKERTVECEIAVHYEYHQIAVKPDNMLWFTKDGRQADLIETVKNHRPIMLGDVAAPHTSNVVDAAATFRPAIRKHHRMRRTFTDRVLSGVDRLGGCATVDAISGLLRVNRGNVCKALNQLSEVQTLGRDAAHLRPGEDHGRPTTLYFRPNSKPQSIHDKVCTLIVSRAMKLLSARPQRQKGGSKTSEYRLHEYDHNRLQMEFRHRTDAAQPALIFVVDDQRQPVDNTYTRLRAAEGRLGSRNAVVAALVAAPTRIARLRSLCKERSPSSRVIDIWQLGRRNPGRETGNAQAGASL